MVAESEACMWQCGMQRGGGVNVKGCSPGFVFRADGLATRQRRERSGHVLLYINMVLILRPGIHASKRLSLTQGCSVPLENCFTLEH